MGKERLDSAKYIGSKKALNRMLKVILDSAKKALKKALPHTLDNQWSIWWGQAGRPLGPRGERGGLIA